MIGHIEDIIAIKSTDALADLLEGYCLANDLSYQSADELLLAVLEREEELKSISLWLNTFIMHWDAVQAEEDFESACAARGEK